MIHGFCSTPEPLLIDTCICYSDICMPDPVIADPAATVSNRELIRPSTNIDDLVLHIAIISPELV